MDSDTPDSEIVQEAANVIRDGGVVCLPCAGRYRLFADLMNDDAVMRLMQAKSRIKTAPALVFIEGVSDIDTLAEDLPPLARKIATELWPQAITIRVKPSTELPKKVLKQLGGKKTKLGLRIPAGEFVQEVIKAVGSPLLVSSANRQKKAGESSAAQVSKTFGAHIDLFVNRGDLKPEPASTIVAIKNETVVIERQGAVAADTIENCARLS